MTSEEAPLKLKVFVKHPVQDTTDLISLQLHVFTADSLRIVADEVKSTQVHSKMHLSLIETGGQHNRQSSVTAG